MAEREIDEDEVAKHDKESDCWIVVGNDANGGAKVYDVTKYLNDHPGGPEIILEFKGKDADDMFEDIGHSSEARSKMKEFLVGTLKVDPTKPKKKSKATTTDVKSGGGLNHFAVVVLLLAIVLGVLYSKGIISF